MMYGPQAALLAELWEEIDVSLPYSEGELLSRVRERGTVEIGYRARDGSFRAVGRDITFADGKPLFFGGSQPQLPDAE